MSTFPITNSTTDVNILLLAEAIGLYDSHTGEVDISWFSDPLGNISNALKGSDATGRDKLFALLKNLMLDPDEPFDDDWIPIRYPDGTVMKDTGVFLVRDTSSGSDVMGLGVRFINEITTEISLQFLLEIFILRTTFLHLYTNFLRIL